MPDLRRVSISTGTIIQTIIILLVLGFLFLIKDVLALLFVAVILSAAFDPLVDWLQKKRIPRALSILGVYIIFLSLVAGAIFLLSGPVVQQIKDVSRDANTAEFYHKIEDGLKNINQFSLGSQSANGASGFSVITDSLSKATNGVFSFIVSLFGGVISFFIILVITFYLVVEEDGMKRFIKTLTPIKHQPYVMQLINRIQQRMGYWLRGQLILSLIVFSLVYLGLSILGIKYALILALIAGLFEIIPYLGPLMSAIPAVFFAFAQGPTRAIMVVGLYFLIQQAENHLIVPKVMGKSVGLNPIVVILSILVGARLGGAVGAILAIPVATAIAVYVEDLVEDKSKADNKLE
ncbi:AI-2E family transporter [Candidatus Nomurabacteria bacterium]|nr:AI-2E family transporter [Candidatus Nomurabacteria bacterium]